MVSPHPEWEDRNGGLVNEVGDDFSSEEVDISVTPVRARFTEGAAAVQSVERGGENGYSIVIRIGLPAYASHDDIITFRDERTAWEFAHLLTHYFEHKMAADPNFALDDLIRSGQGMSPDEQWVPDRIVEDLSAVETFEKLLSPSPTPDGMSNVVE